MRKYFLPAFFLLLSSFWLGCSAPPGKSKIQLWAGASQANVNPPMGAFIAGDRQNRRFTDISDSLFAKAVVVYDGETALALLTVDCIGLLYPTVQAIQSKASNIVSNIPLPAGNIIVSSTHTHSGPDVVGIWGEDYLHSGMDDAYMQQLINTAAEQVMIAAKRLQKVELRSTSGTFGEDFVQNICNEEIDRSVTVLQLADSKGRHVASFTNFACHPTFLDAKYSTVSADYVGGFYKRMDAAVSGVNIFLQGAIGGWVQPEGDDGTYEMAMQRGNELANLVISKLKSPVLLKEKKLRIKSSPIQFRLENQAWRQLSEIGTIPRKLGETVDSEIAWFAIGDAHFVTHPGETTPWHSLETKKMMNTSGPKFVIGLGLDALGYILKPKFFENKSLPHAEYLTSMSVGKHTGPDLMSSLKSLISQ
jgi:hypothetical protein